MAQYSTTTFLTDVRTSGMFPASSNTLFTDADVLRIADTVMQTELVPLVMRTREDYFLTYQDYEITPDGCRVDLRIPYRAIGGAIRNIAQMVDGHPNNIPRMQVSYVNDTKKGYTIEGDLIVFHNYADIWDASTFRVHYFARPNKLVLPAECGTVTDITDAGLVTLSVPDTWTDGHEVVDFVKAKPVYSLLLADLDIGDVGAFPSGLEVGDWVCLAETSPVPQIPTELHPVLVHATVAKMLEFIGDREGMAAAKQSVEQMKAGAVALITPRAVGNRNVVKNQSSPFNRRRRWQLY